MILPCGRLLYRRFKVIETTVFLFLYVWLRETDFTSSELLKDRGDKMTLWSATTIQNGLHVAKMFSSDIGRLLCIE